MPCRFTVKHANIKLYHDNFLFTHILGDLLSAQQKLADYFEREFTEISLYSASGNHSKVALPNLYVAMTWRRFTTAGYGEEEKLSSYADIWKKVKLPY